MFVLSTLFLNTKMVAVTFTEVVYFITIFNLSFKCISRDDSERVQSVTE